MDKWLKHILRVYVAYPFSYEKETLNYCGREICELVFST